MYLVSLDSTRSYLLEQCLKYSLTCFSYRNIFHPFLFNHFSWVTWDGVRPSFKWFKWVLSNTVLFLNESRLNQIYWHIDLFLMIGNCNIVLWMTFKPNYLKMFEWFETSSTMYFQDINLTSSTEKVRFSWPNLDTKSRKKRTMRLPYLFVAPLLSSPSMSGRCKEKEGRWFDRVVVHCTASSLESGVALTWPDSLSVWFASTRDRTSSLVPPGCRTGFTGFHQFLRGLTGLSLVFFWLGFTR